VFTLFFSGDFLLSVAWLTEKNVTKENAKALLPLDGISLAYHERKWNTETPPCIMRTISNCVFFTRTLLFLRTSLDATFGSVFGLMKTKLCERFIDDGWI
jgi:hypothetical protein